MTPDDQGSPPRALRWVKLAAVALALLLVGYALAGLLSSLSRETEDTDTGRPARLARLVKSRRWTEVLKHCDQLGGVQRASLLALCGRARKEKEAEALFHTMRAAASASRHLEALRAHAMIPMESVYKNQDLHLVHQARRQFLSKARKELDQLVKDGSCHEARERAEEIQEASPGDTAAWEKAQECQPTSLPAADAGLPPSKKRAR